MLFKFLTLPQTLQSSLWIVTSKRIKLLIETELHSFIELILHVAFSFGHVACKCREKTVTTSIKIMSYIHVYFTLFIVPYKTQLCDRRWLQAVVDSKSTLHLRKFTCKLSYNDRKYIAQCSRNRQRSINLYANLRMY